VAAPPREARLIETLSFLVIYRGNLGAQSRFFPLISGEIHLPDEAATNAPIDVIGKGSYLPEL